MDLGSTVLAELSYAVPLILALGVAVLVAWWTRSRSASLPPLAASPARDFSIGTADRIVYTSLADGRLLPTIDFLGRRLAQTVEAKLHVPIDRMRTLEAKTLVLESSLSLPAVLDDLLRAYRVAARAEAPGGLNARWPWLHRRRAARARDDFVHVVHEVSTALRSLEAR